MNYTYKAHVTDVYDGDTITVDIDLGFGIWIRKQKIRLANIDAPEVQGAERPRGIVSRDILRNMILDKDVILKTYKDKKGKYGRWIATVLDNEEGIMSINDIMVEMGYAERRVY